MAEGGLGAYAYCVMAGDAPLPLDFADARPNNVNVGRPEHASARKRSTRGRRDAALGWAATALGALTVAQSVGCGRSS
jgi:hypothetical protein